VTGDELRAWCLSLPGAAEEFPFAPGLSVFKVARKVFALSPLSAQPLTVSVKCDPELAESLRASYASIVPGYHLNKRHWITVTANADVPDAMVLELIEDSYDLVGGVSRAQDAGSSPRGRGDAGGRRPRRAARR
jgi:predicted DNA-binding protein (MmcQ/YjbR family)